MNQEEYQRHLEKQKVGQRLAVIVLVMLIVKQDLYVINIGEKRFKNFSAQQRLF